MDNLTHTLIGVSAAHALPRRFRNPGTYWALVLGNNLPDADILQTQFPGATALDYLVHHRGYTHSFLVAPILAIAVAVVASLLTGKRGRIDRSLYAFSLLGCFMHVGADFLNNYGVHPFSPLWNRWFYGDTLFIIEPLVWMSLLPLAYFFAKHKVAKGFWAIVLVAALGLLWSTSLVGLPFKVIATAVAGLSLWVHSRRPSPLPGVIFAASVALLFAMFSWRAQVEVRQHLLAEGFPRESILDIEAVPSPGNPLCWGSWSSIEDPDYLVHRWGQVAILPRVMSAKDCEKQMPREMTVETQAPPALPEDAGFHWSLEVRTQKSQVEHLLAHSCEFRRIMTFLRFPYLRKLEDGRWLTTDLRYDRKERAFTEFKFIARLEPVENCPPKNEPWEFPSLRNQIRNQ